MDYSKSGRLILKKELEKRNDIKFSSKEDSFKITALIPGVSELVEVKVFYNEFKGEYLQLTRSAITYSSANIGEKRSSTLNSILREKILENEKHFAPFKIDDGYVYSRHYSFRKFSHPEKIQILKIINSKDLTLLADETFKDENGVEYLQEYFFNINTKKVYERAYFCDKKEYCYSHLWLKSKPEKLLQELPFYNDICDSYAIDEKNILYKVYDVQNENQIRIFAFDRRHDKTENSVRTIRSQLGENEYHSYTEPEDTLTYREIMRGLTGEELPHKDKVKLPLKIANINIHSKRIIGSEIPSLDIGSWVKTKDDLYAMIGEELKGKTYPLIFDGQYYLDGFESKEYNHDELTVIDNQIIEHKNEPVFFKLHDEGYFNVYAYGFLLAETPGFYKIKPLCKNMNGFSFDIQKEHIYDFAYNYSIKHEDIEKEMIKLHGTSDFVIVKKKDVTILEQDKKERVLEYFSKPISEEEEMFKEILNMAGYRFYIVDYVIEGLNNLLQFKTLPSVTKDFVKFLNQYHSNDKNFLESLEKWFLKMEKVINLKKTS